MQLAQGRSKPTLGVVAAESNATLESSLEPTVLPSALRIQGLQNPKSTHTRVRGRTAHGDGGGSITLIYPRLSGQKTAETQGSSLPFRFALTHSSSLQQ
jgi:hypothetical protein